MTSSKERNARLRKGTSNGTSLAATMTAAERRMSMDVNIRSMRRRYRFQILFITTISLFCIILFYAHLPGEISGYDKDIPLQVEVAQPTKSLSETEEVAVHEEAKHVAEPQSEVPKLKEVKPKKPKMHTILYMEGWMDYPDFYNSDFNTYLDYFSKKSCGYLCAAFSIGERKFSTSRVIVFQPSALRKEPPKKYPNQIWVLHSFDELQDSDVRLFNKHGYERLIDYYIIRPDYALTPLDFNMDTNLINNAGFDTDILLMKYYNKRPELVIGQVLESCLPLSDMEYKEERLKWNLAQLLQQKASQVEIVPLTACYGRYETFTVPETISFVVLDAASCQNNMIDQFIQILMYENVYAIPIVPVLRNEELIEEFKRVAPPSSFISMHDFDNNMDDLLSHLKEIVTNIDLYRSYLNWRGTYSLNTKGGADVHKSAVCKLCQIAYNPPTDNHQIMEDSCESGI